MITDTTEKGLEFLIVRAMTGRTDLLFTPHVAADNTVPVAKGRHRALRLRPGFRPRDDPRSSARLVRRHIQER